MKYHYLKIPFIILLYLSTTSGCTLGMKLTLRNIDNHYIIPNNPDTLDDYEPLPDGDYTEAQQESFDNIVENFEARGIGGGGAMHSFSMSPYSDLWFVGTDMGTLFRSADRGVSWQGIHFNQVNYSSDLDRAMKSLGFCADPNYIFYASKGRNPQISTDGGISWNYINSFPASLIGIVPDIPNGEDDSYEYLRYWQNDFFNEEIIFAASNRTLYFSTDKGSTWKSSEGISGDSVGTYIDYSVAIGAIYHATTDAIYKSIDGGRSFSHYYSIQSGFSIQDFAAGRDADGRTFVILDNDSSAAPDEIGTNKICGYIWVQRNGNDFERLDRYAGRHVEMAENDSQTIYITGDRHWDYATGTRVWISRDAGKTWDLKFQQLENESILWPEANFEYSAVGLDIGYWDGGYYSFNVHRRNSGLAGGTGNFFFHVSRNFGELWESPFTEFADSGSRTEGKYWCSTGLEVTTINTLKFNPANTNLAYAGYADICGLASIDGGQTFRILEIERWSNIPYNSIYDFAFLPGEPDTVYAAVGQHHDFPFGWNGNYIINDHNDIGGIFRSEDRGLTWQRQTAETNDFDRQFLSLAYNTSNNTMYAGTQGGGIARCTDLAANNWEYYNSGISSTQMIIAKIEIDPVNGNVYAVLCGDRPDYTNREQTGVYFLDIANGATEWQLLRGTVNYPPDADAGYQLWWYPSSFAVDFTSSFVSGTTRRSLIWLCDQEVQGSWLTSGIWKTTNGGDTWNLSTQYHIPSSITIDSIDANIVYIGGFEGDVGGGAMYTADGGTTWNKNDAISKNYLRNVVEDPNDSTKLFYLFHGGGMLYADKPN